MIDIHSALISATVRRNRSKLTAGILWQFETIFPVSLFRNTQAVPKVINKNREFFKNKFDSLIDLLHFSITFSGEVFENEL
jgi:hypothetical protein